MHFRYFLVPVASTPAKNQNKVVRPVKPKTPVTKSKTLPVKKSPAANQKKAEEVLRKAKPSATISLFGFGQKDDTSGTQALKPTPPKRVSAPPKPTKPSKAPKGVPTISKWRKNRDGSITGSISGSPAFEDGEKITTSPITGAPSAGAVVRTNSGSRCVSIHFS